jgi:DNA end-binding protein Ku
MSQPLPQPTSPTAPAALGLPATAPAGRPSWSGLLQLSLVNIPLKAYAAIRTRDVPTAHLLHAGCGQRLRYAKHCPCHGPVDAAAITRGYEYAPGRHLVVEPDELDALRPARDRALRLERFVEPAHIDPVLYSGRSLYLVPDGAAAEPAYRVLRAALLQRGRWGLGRMVLANQRQVVLVRPAGTGLVLQVLHYPEQVKACPCSIAIGELATAELHLAGQLIDAASGGFYWDGYRDETAQEVRSLLEAKRQGQPALAEPLPTVLPLLEALQQSLAASQPERKTSEPSTARPAAATSKARRPARPRRKRTA